MRQSKGAASRAAKQALFDEWKAENSHVYDIRPAMIGFNDAPKPEGEGWLKTVNGKFWYLRTNYISAHGKRA